MWEQDKQEIQAAVAGLLEKHPPAMGEVMTHLAAGGGKYLRGRLTLLCSGAGGGGFSLRKRAAVRKKAVGLGAAMEVLHLATLVHDDIIDDADLRRGLPSIQARFGRQVAVIAGDYLFTVCFQAVSQKHREHMEAFAQAMSRICHGEIMQHQHNRDTAMSPMGYLRIISRKTGILFACAAVAGAKTGQAPDRTAKELARYALYLGILFQIVDDCLDFSGSDDSLEKSARKDLAMGVVTLPMLYAFEADPELGRRMADPATTESSLGEMVRAVRQSGGLDRAMDLARKYRRRAEVRLNALPDFTGKAELYDLLDQAVNRTK